MHNDQVQYRKKKTFLKNALGFSLTELMVVVAIIAILSLIGMPSYRLYQARARRVEGFNLLNTYFAQAIAAKAEYGAFPGNFVQTGFQPVGDLMYRLRAEDGTDANIALNDNGCIRTQEPCNCGGGCPDFKTWDEAIVGIVGTRLGTFSVQAGCAPLTNRHVADNTFTVMVAGVITLSATDPDRVGIDERKRIQVCMDGIH